MTIWDLLVTMWRQRVAVLLCAVLSLAVLQAVATEHQVYNGRVSVMFLAPKDAPGNALATTTASLVSMAGVVARMANGPHDAPRTVSAEITLASMGVEQGWSIRQPNAGGQWETRYEDPVLDVRSTGRTLEEAQMSMVVALEQVDAALTQLEDAEQVPQALRIRTELSPEMPAYTMQGGSRMRALAVTAILCAIATGAVALGVDAFRSRPPSRHGSRRARSRRPSRQPVPA
ncbi:hypothetical protein [Cellulomonas soli]|uniref:Polysaccharide chain length determinant N-terminal domain-containing protein n=1 Tax=Cellulomonas soli TaxID=931535 RepID=A0A512PH27_9CELL|nr:hypothetical protein [Cellulomonas soli]NYI59706.1 hypothetical protein [Cellulomonas soli]GEP70500.1 hypothetical protein CSO01_32150 [Cellulomonas soli]